MGEIVQKEKEEFDKDKIGAMIADKARNYLLEYENIIVLKKIALAIERNIDEAKDVAERLAYFYTALKRNSYEVSVRLMEKTLYGYTVDDVTFQNVDINMPYYEPRVDAVLPNGVQIAEVDFHISDFKMKMKENYESTKTYKNQILYLAQVIEEIAHKK
jgi:hypothetical protein